MAMCPKCKYTVRDTEDECGEDYFGDGCPGCGYGRPCPSCRDEGCSYCEEEE